MNVILVDDEQNILKTLTICLESLSCHVKACTSPLQALELARSGDQHFDLAFLDLKMTPIDGIDLMRRLQLLQPGITPVIITAHGTVDTAVDAIKKGAFDYLQKPFDLDELRQFVERVKDFHQMKKGRKDDEQDKNAGPTIITRNAQMHEIIVLAERIADAPLSVLIEGESGTGKELFAQLIHKKSNRRDAPFIRVNCAALPENLLESELFGHAKGAFTGALQERIGRFEAADKGTIFLDEIGEMPISLQAKLLRVLQNNEFERVGESTTRSVDVRVLSATNKNLLAAIEGGEFREDLYYRLNTVRLHIPPLRERMEDIPLLANHFISTYRPSDREPLSISDEVLGILCSHRWKGNVRELENVMSRATFLARGNVIERDDLPKELQSVSVSNVGAPLSLEMMEREHIRRVIAESESYEEAAKKLNIDPATLWRKRKKYDL